MNEPGPSRVSSWFIYHHDLREDIRHVIRSIKNLKRVFAKVCLVAHDIARFLLKFTSKSRVQLDS